MLPDDLRFKPSCPGQTGTTGSIVMTTCLTLTFQAGDPNAAHRNFQITSLRQGIPRFKLHRPGPGRCNIPEYRLLQSVDRFKSSRLCRPCNGTLRPPGPKKRWFQAVPPQARATKELCMQACEAHISSRATAFQSWQPAATHFRVARVDVSSRVARTGTDNTPLSSRNCT